MGEVFEEKNFLLQLIDGQGYFNVTGLDSFAKAENLAQCGLSYAVVSIMGPQSSGKSTLLNHLFHTNFAEMDAFKRRGQTTQGIWLTRAAGIDPFTIVMDLEGTDGRERGEDDTTFEKQSSLFALAVSDIVLINMWCHDIGREHAANKPLLKTVFQVMMRLFTPRKTKLLFVIRDKTKTPLEILEPILREDIQKIWQSVPKPPTHQDATLDCFFNVEVCALPSYEEKEDQFKEQVAMLRTRFFNSIAPGGLAGDRRAVIPGTGFPLSIQEMWKIIKENKDLDLPAHKVMVATVRCEEIAKQKLVDFVSDEEWQNLSETAKEDAVIMFGRKASGLLHKSISEYDTEAAYFESGVRDKKHDFLVGKLLEIVQPAHQSVMGHYRSKSFKKFKHIVEQPTSFQDEVKGFAAVARKASDLCMADFENGCTDANVLHAQWDSFKIRDKLRRDIDTHAAARRKEKITEATAQVERCLEERLAAPAASLLDAASADTWQALRKLFEHEVGVAKLDMSVAISEFEPDDLEESKLLTAVESYGRSIIEKKAKEEAAQALIHMKDRFTSVFSHDSESLPRRWSGDEDIRAITKAARAAALKLLAVLAVVRLDESKSDNIEASLITLLGEVLEPVQATTDREITSSNSAMSTLAASTWEGVLPENVLLTPVQCRALWKQFKAETEYTIGQALAAQEASRRGSSWLPPPWAIVAIIVLGFNEFMTLIRNPIYLAIVFVLYLLGKAIWVQLDIGKEFQNGLLPGALSVSTKVLPTVMNILKRLAEEGQRLGSDDHSRSTVTEESYQRASSSEFSPQRPSDNNSIPIDDKTRVYSVRQRIGKDTTSPR
ncbi:hypothetical protein O6H91_18G004300 [Diphasiastrum complanatum]|uniref:Uncharacterized protein n=2 Tax=Diphasiastrum complanatum TaxID=34168 RepID=A0ACC2AYZ6_DIPCM|nr:hypothetical protein O6H91_18G004300 [Diphasiastrum complanatum]KAJ7522281.1 hypothetical protein O6H91_18G004300 [Diphasiastrum complanatum]